VTVGEFAEKTGLPAADVIRQVFMMGKALTINHLIEPDLCELIALEHGIELEIEPESDEQDVAAYRPAEVEANLARRPPVVTIMGHVDHGKTTLLDAYRSSKIAAGEYGGITQHIGAYSVQTPRGEITFLDTPGHEAFTSMRARGAQVTDIVVLVVAADDGVMPQTVEAINHAREANVPIVVAVNKIDLPNASPARVRNELMQHNILPEDLGGANIFVEISAKKGTRLDELLEMIHLQAEVLELKADPTCQAEGIIIESHVDPLRGSVATVLVRKGTLRLGDIFVVGAQTGRVRVMIDDSGAHVREAGPGHPVEVIGLTGTPEVGELFLVMSEERIAREIASRRTDRRRLYELGATRHVTLEGLHELVEEGKLKDLKIILKADVQGSIEAIGQALQKLSNDEVKVRILHSGTGGINESDASLAAASDAVIIGFNVRPDPAATALAHHEGIEIKTYRVIYELIEEVQKAILGMLEKRYKEVVLGRAEIRQIFRVSRKGNIAGCMVLEGEIPRNAQCRVVRDGIVVHEGAISSLRRVKDDVSKVASGFECGMMLENFNDIKEGDTIEAFTMEEIPVELAAAT
jgi:translation initiation factor IF-2